ncbi:MAG TPA: SIS domain-containing protein, partial [Candidatus Avimonas sp.]|nr:SIS domain-containing protein [Candidatus Avimonas sp.]
ALARPEDVFLGISTSGNSKNVVNAAMVARSLNLAVITLTGESGGALRELSDVCIRVPASETYQVQELHLPVYHALCASVEAHFFDE